MIQNVKTKNWIIGNNPSALNQIHNDETNIAIYDRDITPLSQEIATLINQSTEIRLSGKPESIIQDLEKHLVANKLLIKDVCSLLNLFKNITKSTNFRLLLATVSNNMCRRFHTDVNDLRMLCTYSGPGTLWLEEDNVNRNALDSRIDTASIAKDENSIRQANTGSVVLLKGAIYPTKGTKAIVHRSPSIEESKEKRLLLRVDTNDFLNLNI